MPVIGNIPHATIYYDYVNQRMRTDMSMFGAQSITLDLYGENAQYQVYIISLLFSICPFFVHIDRNTSSLSLSLSLSLSSPLTRSLLTLPDVLSTSLLTSQQISTFSGSSECEYSELDDDMPNFSSLPPADQLSFGGMMTIDGEECEEWNFNFLDVSWCLIRHNDKNATIKQFEVCITHTPPLLRTHLSISITSFLPTVSVLLVGSPLPSFSSPSQLFTHVSPLHPHSTLLHSTPLYSTQSKAVGTKMVFGSMTVGPVDPHFFDPTQFGCPDDPTTLATVSGYVKDAVTGRAISGASVSVDNKEATSNQNGVYNVEGVKIGATVSISASASGYIDSPDRDVVVNGNVAAGTSADINLSPVLKDGSVRFVLTWGAYPSDLDSYLIAPNNGGQVYYRSRSLSYKGASATLDRDDTSVCNPVL